MTCCTRWGNLGRLCQRHFAPPISRASVEELRYRVQDDDEDDDDDDDDDGDDNDRDDDSETDDDEETDEDDLEEEETWQVSAIVSLR